MVTFDAEDNRRWVDYCKKGLDFAAALDRNTRTATLYFSGNPFLDIQKQTDLLYTSVRTISEWAQGTGIGLAMELHPGNFVRSTADAVRIIRDFHLKELGYLFCTAHIGTYCSEDLLDSYELSKEYIRHFHISNTPGMMHAHTHLAPFQGELPIADLLEKLRADGYDGTLSLQMYGEEHDKQEVCAQALDFTKQHLLG